MNQKLLYAFPTRIDTGGEALSLHWPDGEAPFASPRELACRDTLHTIRMRPGALSAEECARVIALGDALPRSTGRVEVGEETYRVGHIAWLEPAPDTHWLYHKLGLLFDEQARAYGFELTGFADALQYTMYGPGQHFDWHMDLGPGPTSVRKLSMTLQLSDGGQYEGGALEFLNAPGLPQMRPAGSAIFFPSYLAHRVAPITSGTRRSLVAWGCGPAFC
jgi:PKHD-type hydroxylase